MLVLTLLVPPTDSSLHSRCLPPTQIQGIRHRTRQLGACVGHRSRLCAWGVGDGHVGGHVIEWPVTVRLIGLSKL